LNESFKQHALDRLMHETYLEVNGLTRRSIVDKLSAFDFERQKKKIDLYSKPEGCFWITGLKSDKSRGLGGLSAKRFGENRMLLD
jgi:hypothetical protein